MNTDVEAGSLQRANQDLGDLLHRAIADLQGFDAELQGHGEPWGNDEVGLVIGEIYKGVYAMAMNCFNTNLDAIDAMGERLGIAADGYVFTDEDSAQQLQTVRQITSTIDLPL